MDTFFKTAGVILLSLILIIAVGKQEKGISIILSLLVCCMLAISAMRYIRPIVDFFYQLEILSSLQNYGLDSLLKIMGIGFISEISSLVCQDAGNASLGKGLQILAAIVMINLSLPIMERLLELIQTVLGGI